MNDYNELERLAKAAKTRGPWCFAEVHCLGPKSSNPYQRDYEYCVAEFRHRHDGNHLRDIYYKEDAEYLGEADPDTVLALIADLKVSTNVGRSLTETLESVCESRDALARAVEQLKAEIEALRRDKSEPCDGCFMADAEALRKDAERYRWLIGNAEEIYFRGHHIHLDPHYAGQEKIKEDADSEIDAAMGKGEQS